MVGGVLVERKVGEVEPALTSNRDKVRFYCKTWFYKEYNWCINTPTLVGSKANITIK